MCDTDRERQPPSLAQERRCQGSSLIRGNQYSRHSRPKTFQRRNLILSRTVCLPVNILSSDTTRKDVLHVLISSMNRKHICAETKKKRDHNKQVVKSPYRTAEWHALAKLRIHTDTTFIRTL